MAEKILNSMKLFPEWLDELRDNKLWYIRIKEMHPRKNLMMIAQEVYAWILAKEIQMDMPSTRALFQKFAKDAPDGTMIVNQVIDEPVKKETVPVSWRERAEWLKKFQKMVDDSPMMKPVFKPTSKQLEEEGQVRPKAVVFQRSELETRLAAIEAVKDARKARRQFFLSAYPDASEEEIQAYIMKFNGTDNPDNLRV